MSVYESSSRVRYSYKSLMFSTCCWSDSNLNTKHETAIKFFWLTFSLMAISKPLWTSHHTWQLNEGKTHLWVGFCWNYFFSFFLSLNEFNFRSSIIWQVRKKLFSFKFHFKFLLFIFYFSLHKHCPDQGWMFEEEYWIVDINNWWNKVNYTLSLITHPKRLLFDTTAAVLKVCLARKSFVASINCLLPSTSFGFLLLLLLTDEMQSSFIKLHVTKDYN